MLGTQIAPGILLNVTGVMETNVLNFLLDSGATSSFISNGSFERCDGEQVLPLQHGAATVKDVDCKSIKIYG